MCQNVFFPRIERKVKNFLKEQCKFSYLDQNFNCYIKRRWDVIANNFAKFLKFAKFYLVAQIYTRARTHIHTHTTSAHALRVTTSTKVSIHFFFLFLIARLNYLRRIYWLQANSQDDRLRRDAPRVVDLSLMSHINYVAC